MVDSPAVLETTFQAPLSENSNVSSYLKQFKHNLEITHFRHLFHSHENIERCVRLLEDTQLSDQIQGRPTEDIIHKEPFRSCQALVNACVHPSTKEIIPCYARMAAFAPISIPVCIGLLFSAPTLSNLIGWQVINQTYMAIFNYTNSAKIESSNKDNKKTLLRGYAGAVLVSAGLSVSLNHWLKVAQVSSRTRMFMKAMIPYTAVASAAAANVLLVRGHELRTGLPVRTPDGVHIGCSRAASRKGLAETVLSRAVLSIPILLLPLPFVSLVLRLPITRKYPILKPITELSFLTLGIGIGLPAAIALFPTESRLPLRDLEPELKSDFEFRWNASNGSPAPAEVLFNRGV